MSEENRTPKAANPEDWSAYAGRWVAVADGKVTGVGETAVAAELLGRRNRFREKLDIRFVEPSGGSPLEVPPIMPKLEEIFFHHDQPIYLVGGTVRDMLLGRTCKDLDFAVPTDAIKLAFKAADWLRVPAFPLDKERDTGRVIVRDHGVILDFAVLRGDGIEVDLRSRDYTINAMALPYAASTTSSIIDPCRGKDDLQQKLLRATSEHAIADDPVRALRGLRLALQLGLTIEPATSMAIRSAGLLLESVSNERIRDELITMLSGDTAGEALPALMGHDLLAYTLPEIAALQGIEQSAPHHEGALDHTVSVVLALRQVEDVLFQGSGDGGPAMSALVESLAVYREPLLKHLSRPIDGGVHGKLLLRLGALFHDTGKAMSQEVQEDGRVRFFGHAELGAKLAAKRLRQLHYSRETVEHVSRIVYGHMWPLLLAKEPSLSSRAVYRYFLRSGPAGLDIGLLSLADYLATHGGLGEEANWRALLKVVERLFDHFFNHYDEMIRPAPLLSGKELLELFDLEPGPVVGELLAILQEAQAAGDVADASQAKELVAKVLASRGEGADSAD